MAISTIATSVEISSRLSVRGTPSSLFSFCLLATTAAWGRPRAARISLVDGLPVAPVLPTTRAAAQLPLLVPLPRDHHPLARASGLHRQRDRRAAVELHLHVQLARDLRRDRLRILAARVVSRDDGPVREPSGHRAHQRPLAPVPVAA